jgi:hypothetical protein
MNIINKILILIIIIFLINYLTDGKIIETIKSYFLIYKKKVEEFIDLTMYSNNPEYLDDFYKLNDFMKNLINVNTNYYNLTLSRDKKITADKSLINDIMNQLSKVLNCHGFRFNNIQLLDKIYYYENHIGKEIELFSISADVYYRDKSLGSVIMNFEIFLRNDIVISKEFKNGLLTITNVKLLSRNSQLLNETIPKVNTKIINEKSKDFLEYEPASFESKDSKTSMLLNNLSKTQIVYEPYQAKLDKLDSLSMTKNEPASFESKDSKTSMLLNNLSKTQIVYEPYQAKLDKLNSSSTMMNEPASFESKDSKTSMLLNNLSKTQIVYEPGEKVLTFSPARYSEKSKDFLEYEPNGYINSPTKYQREIEKPMKNTLIQQKAIQKTHDLATKMTDSFNNYFIGREDNDNLFIKPTDSYITEGFMNDTDNSLIPSIIELSSYEQMSNTDTSN